MRGISIKLQEEERERRDNWVPETSYLDPSQHPQIPVDQETKDMLDHYVSSCKPLYALMVLMTRSLGIQSGGGGEECRSSLEIKSYWSVVDLTRMAMVGFCCWDGIKFGVYFSFCFT